MNAKLIDRWEEKRQIFTAMFAKLSEKVNVAKDWRAAEFGIGKWGFGRFYAEHVASVVGIDIENYASHHPGVEFALSDGVTIPLASNSVDLTVSHSVLEHVGDLDQSMYEINRITRPGGYLFLTVSPLYYSGYGSHLRRDGKRLENWEHLDPNSRYYMVSNPLPDAPTEGHFLNKMTSSTFLTTVGRQPWSILSYELAFEKKALPSWVDRTQCSHLDLVLKGFTFVGRKVA